MRNPVVVIGVSVDGLASLTPRAKAFIKEANQLWGSERLLELIPEFAGRRTVLSKGIASELETLKDRGAGVNVVVLASGDPGFFGVGSSLLNDLPPDEVVLIPQVTSLQAAFAHARLSWQDAHLTSAHARPLAEVVGLARRFRKLGILTDPRHTPALIAEKLLASGIPDCRAVVCENLGEPGEALTNLRLNQLPEHAFSSLNVLILVQDDDWRPAPLLSPRPDTAYAHRNGLITKVDVRALCLSRLALRETDVVWDIGAGSGAVSIEMAELAWRGQVVAIEKDAECLGYIHENVARFGVLNVEVVAGEAPAALRDLPAPDAVFIGGSSGQLCEILEQVNQAARPGCRLVATFTILENMLQANHWLKDAGWEPALAQAQMAYSAPLGEGTRLAPANPIFFVNGRKP